MADVGVWYNQLTRFTRYWLTATIAASLCSRFGILPFHYVYLSRRVVLSEWKLWRCLTSLVVYPLTSGTGFHFLTNCYFIVNVIPRCMAPGKFLGLMAVRHEVFTNGYNPEKTNIESACANPTIKN
ncbi:hypothetical protein GQX74_014769 [Glossina fuscipes]|nr:hypothetical protein GQX74_014769 [Glossina fuscipes]